MVLPSLELSCWLQILSIVPPTTCKGKAAKAMHMCHHRHLIIYLVSSIPILSVSLLPIRNATHIESWLSILQFLDTSSNLYSLRMERRLPHLLDRLPSRESNASKSRIHSAPINSHAGPRHSVSRPAVTVLPSATRARHLQVKREPTHLLDPLPFPRIRSPKLNTAKYQPTTTRLQRIRVRGLRRCTCRPPALVPPMVCKSRGSQKVSGGGIRDKRSTVTQDQGIRRRDLRRSPAHIPTWSARLGVQRIRPATRGSSWSIRVGVFPFGHF